MQSPKRFSRRVIGADVERGVERLRGLPAAVKEGQLKMVGATLELRTGKVSVLG